MALATLTIVSCEKEDDNYSTDFSGMWAYVAEYDSEDGTYVYDKVDEVLSFEGGRVKIYSTRLDSGYDFKNGLAAHNDILVVHPLTAQGSAHITHRGVFFVRVVVVGKRKAHLWGASLQQSYRCIHLLGRTLIHCYVGNLQPPFFLQV